MFPFAGVDLTDERTFAKKLTTKLDSAKFRGVFRGVIGWDQGDGTVLLRSTDLRDNEVFVTFHDDTRQVVAALCLKVKRAIGLNVLVERNVDGRWEIIGTDNEPAMQMFGIATPDVYNPDETGALDKSLRSTFNLKEGRGRALDNGSMFIYIDPFQYDGGYFPGGALDLTAFQPGTASTQAWVVVAIDPSDNSLDGFTGTEYSLAQTMSESLIADVTVTNGFYPCWAWVLTDSQTIITPQTTNADARLWFMPTGTNILAVRDIDTTPTVTPVTTIEFTNGAVSDQGGGVARIDLSVAGGDSTLSDTFANRGAASNAGNLFFPTDGYTVQRDTGAAWQPWGPIFPLTEPPTASWSWVNQGGATITSAKGGEYLYAPAGAGVNLRCRVRTAPSAPYTITALFLPQILNEASHTYGLLFRESGTGEIATLMIQGQGTYLSMFSAKYDSPTVFNASYTSVNVPSQLMWMRIADDNTNRIVSYSMDGQNFIPLHSVTRTDFLTADQVGFFVSSQNASWDAAANLISWVAA